MIGTFFLKTECPVLVIFLDEIYTAHKTIHVYLVWQWNEKYTTMSITLNVCALWCSVLHDWHFDSWSWHAIRCSNSLIHHSSVALFWLQTEGEGSKDSWEEKKSMVEFESRLLRIKTQTSSTVCNTVFVKYILILMLYVCAAYSRNYSFLNLYSWGEFRIF